MAITKSENISLGMKAPDFELIDYNFGNIISLQKNKGNKGTVIMFLCNHCPFVKHIINILIEIVNQFKNKGITFIGINSNDIINYPDDSPEKMKKIAHDNKYPFFYLFDEKQDIAKKYFATCTPDFYLFNSNLELVYHGQIDDSTPNNNIPITGKDLCFAIKNLINNKPISQKQNPSFGCSIKWKKK